MNTSKMKTALYCTLTALMTISAGCALPGSPRARIGHLSTATVGIHFPDPNNIGTHAYGGLGFGESCGIIYTCKAGHIDLSHIRGNADVTYYLVKKIRKTLSKEKKGFWFVLTGELSSHHIRFTYPENWDGQKEKDKIIEEIVYPTAQYIAYNATIWHEIQTWFGVHYAGFEPEFNSAFSWEDMYSNLIGVRLAVEAIKDPNHDFDEAMTLAIQREFDKLQARPSSVAYHASDKMRGKWYTGNVVPDVKMRNFDIGLDDGYITPVLVPGIEDCNSEPLPQPVPTLDTLNNYGFSMTYRIKPNVLEQWAMFEAAGTNEIYVKKHYPVFLEFMKKQAEEKGYSYIE